MKRVQVDGRTHFCGCHLTTLCGLPIVQRDLLGQPIGHAKESNGQVDCPDCATLYCQVKNTPWNEVEDTTLDRGIYAAGGCPQEGGDDGEEL